MENNNKITSAYNATIWKQSIAKTGENNPNYNKPCPDEIKRKISDSQKLRWQTIRKALQLEDKSIFRVSEIREACERHIDKEVIRQYVDEYLHELFTDQF